MVRGYEIIVDGEAVAGMTKCDEGERGNICILRDYESPMWFDWWSYDQRSTARRMADRFIRNNFGENASTRLVYVE